MHRSISLGIHESVGRIPVPGAPRLRLNFWDLGGQKELESLWAKYFDEAHGLIFVVDASDRQRIENVRDALGNPLLKNWER